MRLRVLGCSGAEFPNFHTPAFLIDNSLLLDAGTIGAVLNEEEQWAIKHIFVTHTHLDHIKGIPLLADNIIIKGIKHTVRVASTRENLQAIRDHLLNNVIWPDFSMIPSVNSPVIEYLEIEPEVEMPVNGYTVTAFRVNHSVPAVGYIVRKENKALLYTGDTGPTEEIWRHAVNLSAMIVEVSLPNEMEQMALLTGHLTAKLLAAELRKLAELPPRIFITHPKPQYYNTIRSELQALGIPQIELLHDGDVYDL
jgi:ribonuclease BN (tRNA processing enzyme)